MAPKSCDLTLLIFSLGSFKSLVYVNKPWNICDLKRKFDELSGSYSEFHRQSSCIPALQRWPYARHHFAYLKWEGELNMFMSFFKCFEKIKLIILLIKTGMLVEGPFRSCCCFFRKKKSPYTFVWDTVQNILTLGEFHTCFTTAYRD